MAGQVTRKQFVHGDIGGRHKAVRPPWTFPEDAFIEQCQRAGACIAVCPERILEKGRGGFPQVNFARGGCAFCGACVEACTSGVYRKDGKGKPEGSAWLLKAQVRQSCLAFSKVVCRTCGEHCPENAIRFPPVFGGVARPEVNLAQCTGCGVCFAPCPNEAIELVVMM